MHEADDGLLEKYDFKAWKDRFFKEIDVYKRQTDNSIVDKRIKKIDGMENKTITLGTLAAVDLKYKGFETAIKAIKQLVKEGYAIQYRIAAVSYTHLDVYKRQRQMRLEWSGL